MCLRRCWKLRKFLIFTVLALVVCSLAIPSFASEVDSYVITVDHGTIGSNQLRVPNGTYGVKFVDELGFTLYSGTVEINDNSNVGFYYNYLGVTYNASIFYVADVENSYFYGDILTTVKPIQPIDISGTITYSVPKGDVSSMGEITSVFTGIGVYLIGAFSSLGAIFWTGSSLTIVGVLSVCALAVAIVLYVIYLIRTFW